jgi:hypothetical protein
MAKVITSQLTKVIRIEHEIRIYPTDKPQDLINALGKVFGKLENWDLGGSEGNHDYLSLKFIEEKKVVE